MERAETDIRQQVDNEFHSTRGVQVIAGGWGFLAVPRTVGKDWPLKEAFVSWTSCPCAFPLRVVGQRD